MYDICMVERRRKTFRTAFGEFTGLIPLVEVF